MKLTRPLAIIAATFAGTSAVFFFIASNTLDYQAALAALLGAAVFAALNAIDK